MIIEHRTFRLLPETDEAAFVAADRRVQTEVAPFRHGFIRRTTAHGVDGRWLVETLWYDDACAEVGAVDRHPADEELGALVDPDTDRTERWTTLA